MDKLLEIPFDKRKVKELYRQMMNLMERNSAKTEEGFCALMMGIQTITENPELPATARAALRQRAVEILQEVAQPPSLTVLD